MWQADPGQHPHSSSLTSLSLTGRGQKIGRRKARKFELLWEGSRENSCVRCHQIHHLLSLVAALRQSRKMKVLGTLRKRLTGGGTPCCTSDKWTPPSTSQEAVDPLLSHHQAEGKDLRDGGEWKWVCAWRGRQIPS